MRLFLALIGCMAWAWSAQAADCVIDFHYFIFGQDFDTNLRVKEGKICIGSFNIRGGGIQSLRVLTQAHHGVAAVAGVRKYAYKPAPGFTGQDDFIIEMTGETMGRRTFSGTTNIHVSVNVYP